MHYVYVAMRLNEPAQERKALPLTARDLEDLDRLRSPGPERTALADLSGSQLEGEVTESVLLHAIFAAGLRVVQEMAEASAYAEAASERRVTEGEDRRIARRRRPSWADEDHD
jgi:hypothetical protein